MNESIKKPRMNQSVTNAVGKRMTGWTKELIMDHPHIILLHETARVK